MVEKRKHTRLNIRVDTELVRSDGSTLKGETIDISFGGAFVSLPSVSGISTGDQCTLRLDLSTVSIEISCTAVRLTKEGVGVQLISIDLDSYEHFKNMMVLNSPDPDILFEELEKHPGLLKEAE